MVQVDRHQRIGRGEQNTLHRTVGGSFEGCVDFFLGGGATGNDLQVHDRDVRGRDADRRTVQLALQFRQDQTHSLGGAGRGRDHRQGSSATAVRVFVHGVEGRLVTGIGVDGGHVATLDADQFVQNLGDRGQAVGGARSVRDDDVVGTEGFVVHAEDDGLVSVVSRS